MRWLGFFIKEYFQPQPATGRLEFQPATGNRQPALNFQPQPATATATGNRHCNWVENTYFPFLFVLPCGRLFLENNYFPLCLCCPAGGFFWNITISNFVCVALRAASILKKSCFVVFNKVSSHCKLPNLLGFDPREYARTLSFEKCCRMH